MIRLKSGEYNTQLNDGISNEEGCMALEAILANPHIQIMVSKMCITDEEYSLKTEKNKLMTQMESPSSLSDKVKLVWSEVLGIENITLDSDFFSLGGDSLMAIQLSYRLKVTTGINASPDILLEYPQLKDFIKRIDVN